MKILILSGSPKGETSITLKTTEFIPKMFPEDEFTTEMIGTGEYTERIGERIKEADLVILTGSIYHCSIHTQTMCFLDAMVKNIGNDIQGKPFTYLTTSMFLMEVPAHTYVEQFFKRNGLRYIRSLSLKDDDVLSEKGREELYRWFEYIKQTATLDSNDITFENNGNIVILDTSDDDETRNDAIIKEVMDYCMKKSGNVRVVSVKDYTVKHCSACYGCYSTRKCVIQDDFAKLVSDVYDGTDVLITVGTLKYGMLGTNYKKWLDRHVQFGRCALDDELIKLYIYNTTEDTEPQDKELFKTHTLALDSLVGSYFVDTICGGEHGELNMDTIHNSIDDCILICKNELIPQRNIYRVTLNNQFAGLAHTLQNMCPKDYEYYKMKGYYEPKEVNPHVRYINNGSESLEARKMRLVPYKMALQDIEGAPTLTIRRPQKISPIAKNTRGQESAKEPAKKFGLFRRKDK